MKVPGLVWRRLILVAVVIVALAVTVVVTIPKQYSTADFAPNNPEPHGSMALAQILEQQGVRVRVVDTSKQALTVATPAATVVVFNPDFVPQQRLANLTASGAHVVLVEPSIGNLTGLALPVGWGAAGTGSPVVAANCPHPAAAAAGVISQPAQVLKAAQGCFPSGTGFVMVPVQARLTLLSTGTIFTNAKLAQAGNAALTLHLLGAQPNLIWLNATWVGENEPAAPPPSLPPAASAMLVVGLVCVGLLALWRGRRFGRLVAEPLPVLVKSVEATRGRGRLYRRGRDYSHTADALRAGTAARLAARAGVAVGASRPQLVDALARELHLDARQVDQTLYGPPPTSDAQLLFLSAALQELETAGAPEVAVTKPGPARRRHAPASPPPDRP